MSGFDPSQKKLVRSGKTSEIRTIGLSKIRQRENELGMVAVVDRGRKYRCHPHDGRDTDSHQKL